MIKLDTMIERINALKKEKNAMIIAHLYQKAEVQDIADFVGDSFELSKKAKENDAETIVFCGVHFMAESAKILSPHKKVLLPRSDAGCPMADMVSEKEVKLLREKYPDAAIVCYVNSSAEVKALSDICCTSSNAVKVVESLPHKQIVFIPDENLGNYVAKQVKDKEIIPFKGYCITHKLVTREEVIRIKNEFPEAELLVHPECTEEVLGEADFAGSTAQIINYVKHSNKDTFIIGTEEGILHKLHNENPGKTFYLASPKLICMNMKKTSLEAVLDALENETTEIVLEDEVRERAYLSLNRMLEV
ncbi:quinolinate synthase NadA [Natranaerovirga pectinivora]|uniref:quinolinate synthase NadA n=1 Tax=Natranaerovirga pectinivora TaxID=682400 RepID=UPI001A9B3469|nr:quinolinate synthase NadA [Natranaerovirga pectinivora]